MTEAVTIAVYITLYISLFFEVFLLVTYIERKSDMMEETQEKPLLKFPSVTIIVPCFNEEKTVAGTIESLLKLEYPKDKFNILVVDDGSKDNTLTAAKAFENNPQVTVHSKINGGKYTALNFALERINTDLVGCLDADSFVEKSALKRIVACFERDQKIMAVTPAIKVHNAKSLIQLIQKVEYCWAILIKKMFSYMDAIYVTPGPFSIFRTSIFKELGLYKHAHNTEDLEMALRIQANNYKIENAHTAYVLTVAPKTLKKLYKQRLRWTYGFLKNMIDYRHMLFNRKYGNLGLFILPLATISIFTVLFFTGNTIYNLGHILAEKFTKVQTVGVDLSLSHMHFDWFFINTESLVLVVYALFILTLSLVLIARHSVEKKILPSLDLVYFLFLYAFIAPLWLGKAVYNVAFSVTTAWR